MARSSIITPVLIIALVLSHAANGIERTSSDVPRVIVSQGYIVDNRELSSGMLFFATQRGRGHQRIGVAADRWSIDPWILKGVFTIESGMRPNVVNDDTGAAGIAQFTAGGRAAVRNLRSRRGAPASFSLDDAMDPDEAVPAAAELLNHCMSEYGIEGGLSAYNGGPRMGRAGATSYSRAVISLARSMRDDAAGGRR